MIELIIPGNPIPWKAPYVGTRGAFSVRTPVMNQMKALISCQLEEIFCKKSESPWFTGAIAVDMIFLMAIPKGISKKKSEQMIEGTIRPEKRPDRGNLLKLFEDVLQSILIEDDSLIVDGRVSKYYSAEPKTIIRVYDIHEYETLNGRMKYAP